MATQTIRARLRDQSGQIRDQSGQILVLTAVSMVALLGIAALTLDTSFMFAKRNRLHAAADAAAKSAAIEIIRDSAISQASLEAFADQQVIAHGFLPSRQGGTTAWLSTTALRVVRLPGTRAMSRPSSLNPRPLFLARSSDGSP